MAVATNVQLNAASGRGIYFGVPNPEPPDWMASRPLWEWFEIPGTKLSDCPPTVESGGDPATKLTAWTGIAVDRANNTIYNYQNGGHSDYAGNEVNRLNLNTNSPAWEEIEPGAPKARNRNGTPYNLDGIPMPAHTYWATHHLSSINCLVVFCRGGTSGIAGMADAPPPADYDLNDSYSKVYDLTAGEYDLGLSTRIAQHPSGIGASFSTDSALGVLDERTDDFYFAQNGGSLGIQKWTRATNSWSKLSSNDMLGREWYVGTAIDTNRNRFVCIGSNSGRSGFQMDLATGADIPGTTWTGSSSVLTQISGYPSLEWAPDQNRFYGIYNHSTNDTIELITIDPTGGETLDVQIPTVTGTKPTRKPNGLCSAARYLPNLGLIVVPNKYTENVKAIRVHEV